MIHMFFGGEIGVQDHTALPHGMQIGLFVVKEGDLDQVATLVGLTVGEPLHGVKGLMDISDKVDLQPVKACPPQLASNVALVEVSSRIIR